MAMKTCAFYTLGCKVNQYETQSIREDFIKAGYEELGFNQSCDVYVINTCTVTAKTDKESRRAVRMARRKNAYARIVVTGCYTELDEKELYNIPGISLIVKNRDKNRIVDIIDSAGSYNVQSCKNIQFNSNGQSKNYMPMSISDFKDRTRVFLKIQDGCDNFCSYCKIPVVRGCSRSRDEESILAEMGRLVKRGYKKIVLTGICPGAWGMDLMPKRGLSSLIRQLLKIGGEFRIRLSSIEPGYVSNELIGLIASSAKLCKHLHMPLQSGDDEILKEMNRPYTSNKYLNIIKEIRKRMPDISITTDILVGFPGETDRNFRNTYRLLKIIRPSRVHVFPFSRRAGTAAAGLKEEISKDIIRNRTKSIRILSLKNSYKYRRNFLMKKAEVLVEAERGIETGFLKGYDDNYIKILLKSPEAYKSRVIPVRIKKVDTERTFGIIL